MIQSSYKFITILIFIISITSTSTAVVNTSPQEQPKPITMKCIYTSDYQFGSKQNLYACEISGRLQVTRRNTVVSAVEGNHTLNRNNDDVFGFKADAALINYLPKGINQIFRNLRAILINFSQLKEIKQENLRPFTKLKYLDLFENLIQYLEADLFKFNPDLEVIWLSNNKIQFIHESVFESLKNVRSLYLGYNQCISKSFADNPSKMTYFLEIIAVQCGSKSPGAKAIQTNPPDDDYDDDSAIDENPNAELDAAQVKIQQLQTQMRRIEDEVFHLKRKRESALIELSKYQDENQKLKEAQNKTIKEMTMLQEKIKKMDVDGVGYIRQITTMREDMRKQIDNTDSVVKDFRNELSMLNISLNIEKDEINRLRIENDRRLTQNLELHKELDELQEKKRVNDLISLIVIFLLAFVAVGAIVPMVMKKIKERGGVMRSRSWNGFENVKMMNERQGNVEN